MLALREAVTGQSPDSSSRVGEKSEMETQPIMQWWPNFVYDSVDFGLSKDMEESLVASGWPSPRGLLMGLYSVLVAQVTCFLNDIDCTRVLLRHSEVTLVA